jgi:hypothetical protein
VYRFGGGLRLWMHPVGRLRRARVREQLDSPPAEFISMIDSALVGIHAPDKKFGSYAEGDPHESPDQ